MNRVPFPIGRSYLLPVFALVCSLMSPGHAPAAPTIVSTVPTNGATSVPLSAVVVITFSEPMNTSVTMAYLWDSTAYQVLWASSSWTVGNRVLTCTPVAALPASHIISWSVMNGQSAAGAPLAGFTGGNFTTASGVQLTLTNALWSGGTFAFDVISQAGQNLSVEYSSTLRSNEWQTLLTTNSPTGSVHIVDPNSSANRYLFYRARTGS
jgi:hypothetical protein